MEIRTPTLEDLTVLEVVDIHITSERLRAAIAEERVIVLTEKKGQVVGWLRFSYFWDTFPFMDMLFVMAEERGKGYGKKLIAYFEQRMKEKGYLTIMTSTSANEQAQHLYYQLGYQSVGGFFPPAESYELLLSKQL